MFDMILKEFGDIWYYPKSRVSGDSVQIAVPGFRKEDLKIEIDEGVIRVIGKRGDRSIDTSVAIGVDTDNATAKCEDGLLTISFKKTPKKLISID